ncbi:MAG: sigma 54-interacting transcriptional regulator [Myxococcota bacterium]
MPTLKCGARIAKRYEVIRPLGHGGQGGMLLVHDTLLDRKVALKRVHDDRDVWIRASLEREFLALSSLSICGVAPVFDFGTLPEIPGDRGGSYFTRAFIDGTSLCTAAKPWSAQKRLEAFVATTRIVSAIHRAGAVHGDLKPSNVIVNPANRLYLIDFGFASLPCTPGFHGSGTPAFMAPEVLSGEAPSEKSDVYALAVTLLYLFGFRGRVRTSDIQLPVELCELLGERVELLNRGLEPKPQERLPSVSEYAVLAPQGLGERRSIFVPPRPKGTEDHVAQLDHSIPPLLGSEPLRLQLIVGGSGFGKTTLLHELKWRLQLRGVYVVWLSLTPNSSLSATVALLKQLVFVTEVDAAKELLLRLQRAETVLVRDFESTLNRSLDSIRRDKRIVFLVDDIDFIDPLLISILRSALHAECPYPVIGTASDPEVNGVRAVGAVDKTHLNPLCSADLNAVVRESLGAVDESVIESIASVTGGIPGKVIDLMSGLFVVQGATATDVEHAASEIQEPQAEVLAQRFGLSRSGLKILMLLKIAGTQISRAFARACVSEECLAEAVDGTLIVQQEELLFMGNPDVLRELSVEECCAYLAEVQSLLLGAASELLSPLALARLAVCFDVARPHQETIRSVTRTLERQGGYREALQFSSRLLELTCASDDAASVGDRVLHGKILHELGRNEESASTLQPVLLSHSLSKDELTRVAILAGRCLTSLGRLDEALAVLQTVPNDASALVRATAMREQVKILLRRGAHADVLSAVDGALALLEEDSPVRIELLTSAGMVHSYAGRRERARDLFRTASRIASNFGSLRDEANVLGYLAIDYQRAGDFSKAKALYDRILDVVRGLGDVSSLAVFSMNAGAVHYALGNYAAAAKLYASARCFARRAARRSTEIMAAANLAHLNAYLGLYERARSEAETARTQSEEAEFEVSLALSVHVLAELAIRASDFELGLRYYDEALSHYRSLAMSREMAEVHIDVAEALLNRDALADSTLASSHLAYAGNLLQQEPGEDLHLSFDLMLARAQGSHGDVEGALSSLEALAQRAKEARCRTVEWRALAELGRLNAGRGAEARAERWDALALGVLESIAVGLPPEFQESFWHDPRRRDLRHRASSRLDLQTSAPTDQARDPSSASSFVRTRMRHLIEITKQLASERSRDSLVERIIDSAVALSGAERGIVLLLGPNGVLDPHLVRDSTLGASDPHVAFSRSIAEAVLIDGEPLTAVDALDDPRLDEYVSVHRLMLKSVAGFPIRSVRGPIGVLYLEHRTRRCRFQEEDVDLLLAFAELAAIAYEHARLVEENDSKNRDLERTNAELTLANREIERVLAARTEELASMNNASMSRRDQGGARSPTQLGYEKFGIVGCSAAMRRVYARIDRVCHADVPVVLQGESGTGKELVAKAIHLSGPRQSGPFVAVNCAAIPDSLVESELFGYMKGAFSGATVDRDGVVARSSGGTLFLDELGDMSARMQTVLLRVLQEGRVRKLGSDVDEEVNIRVVCASNKYLPDLVASGVFRADLFYRLHVVEICLPPLRERAEDLHLICEHLLCKISARQGADTKRLTGSALRALAAHPLPGNVRQLEHLLANACVMVEGASIDVDDLVITEAAPAQLDAQERVDAQERDSKDTHVQSSGQDGEAVPKSLHDYKEAEKERILSALEATGWNRARAAKSVSMPRRTFYRRLKEYGIL